MLGEPARWARISGSSHALGLAAVPDATPSDPAIHVESSREAALVTILTEPKNALIKQYQKKFEFDNIGLKFTDGALTAIAHEAYKRKVGARGLMMILEEILLESMYHLPSEKKVKEIVVTKEMIERKAPVFEVIPRSEEAA